MTSPAPRRGGDIAPGTLVIAAGVSPDPSERSARADAVTAAATLTIDLAAPGSTVGPDDLDAIMAEVAAGGVVVARPGQGMPTGAAPSAAPLVEAATDAGHRVVVVPGSDPVVAALAGSGLDVDRFIVDGDLPANPVERGQRLGALVTRGRAIALPTAHDVVHTRLAELVEVTEADRPAAVVVAAGTANERVSRGTITEMASAHQGSRPDGTDSSDSSDSSVVIVVAGGVTEARVLDDEELRHALSAQLATGMTRRDAVAAVVAATGAPRRRVYDLAVALP